MTGTNSPNHKTMVSQRRFRLATTTGRVYTFEPGEPVQVHDTAVVEAQTYGCVVVDGSGTVTPEASSKVMFDFVGDLRASAIYLAVSELIDENSHTSFDAAGTPKASVVSDRLGISVTQKEVTAALRMYQAGKADGRTIELSPEVHNVMRVINAEGAQDLRALAKELEISDDEVKSMTPRQLRKRLMGTFTGLVVG